MKSACAAPLVWGCVGKSHDDRTREKVKQWLDTFLLFFMQTMSELRLTKHRNNIATTTNDDLCCCLSSQSLLKRLFVGNASTLVKLIFKP